MPLATQIRDLGITDRCHLLGPRSDMPRICAALDVMALSSISEAFPLVLGEAMACGVPCAATDVGDARLIVGKTGRIVPVRTPAALGQAFAELLNMPEDERRGLSDAARQRVCDMFDLDAVIGRYESFHLSLAAADTAAERAEEPFTPTLFAGRTGELS
jgi:glycosyltransferase involved in cell wall biosynthesis